MTKHDTWRIALAIALLLTAFLLVGCVDTGGGTPTPDITVNDKAREDTIEMVTDAWATRDAR